jgi:hypothetical protein
MSATVDLADVMVDVAPEVVVMRKQGHWSWHARQGVTKEAVLKELQFQINRSSMKRDLLEEALEALSREDS